MCGCECGGVCGVDHARAERRQCRKKNIYRERKETKNGECQEERGSNSLIYASVGERKQFVLWEGVLFVAMVGMNKCLLYALGAFYPVNRRV